MSYGIYKTALLERNKKRGTGGGIILNDSVQVLTTECSFCPTSSCLVGPTYEVWLFDLRLCLRSTYENTFYRFGLVSPV